MKKQTVSISPMLSGFTRISCVTVLLFTLNACGGSSGGDSAPGSAADSGGGADTSSGSGSAPTIKLLDANDNLHGFELWKTDGTSAGTVLLKDINNTAAGVSSHAAGFTEFNSAFYFQADDGVNGIELWKTDGTAAGTVLLKDINTTTANANSYPSGFTVFNSALYFTAVNSVDGRQKLWKTDGTSAGTVLVKDIYTPAISSSYPNFTVFNGALYLAADDGVNGLELWKSDGTDAGTVLVKDINTTTDGARSYPFGFTELNGVLYFQADDGVHGSELWKTDGTAAGTVLVKGINTTTDPYPGSWSSNPLSFIGFNGALYFQADDGVHGVELWKTDGTAAGTILVKDINTAPGPIPQPSNPAAFIVFNGALYFKANDGVNSGDFWKTDGTAAGTVRVQDITGASFIDSHGLIVFSGALYFTTENGNSYDLWKTDGSTVGTVLVKNFTSVSPYPWGTAYPFNFTEINGVLYFQADNGINGRESWITDGTAAGTQLLKDICPGVCDGFQYY